MAGILHTPQAPLHYFRPRSRNGIWCFSTGPDNNNSGKSYKRETPQLLRIAVSGVTELLRLFSASQGPTRVTEKRRDEFSVSSVDDVVTILKSDYRNAYFVTGVFSSAIYAENCIFEDPTIRFRGKELYSRNLKLLVPFLDSPSIVLQKIEKDITSETKFVVATWKLRTYLKLPWRPLISINGSTIYELDGELTIVRHAESWGVTALEAVGQIFIPSVGQLDE
ncbi:hypothetical protein PanWU01x14_054390 [Parasponia andersonii]|uniref:NTF2-like domain containing protein n=1 Tax=Parasponia andersonii TaxID=3476 RepID=A0A2P5DKS1_PARAD|nr:hypothetical protein PanWU01x14_054390 [Parasponia andersonii]